MRLASARRGRATSALDTIERRCHRTQLCRHLTGFPPGESSYLLTGGCLRIIIGDSFRLPEYQRKDPIKWPPLRFPASPAPPAAPPSARPDVESLLSGPSVFLFVILTSQLMVVLDRTIVNVAPPHIQEGLGFSGGALSWVLNAYLLTFGGLLLLGARGGTFSVGGAPSWRVSLSSR